METRYFGKPIEVITDEGSTDPRLFRFDGQNYTVTQILESWPDNGFGSNSSGQSKWYQRHHRKYYRVATEDEVIFEIYYDRGISKNSPVTRKWFVTRRIDHQR